MKIYYLEKLTRIPSFWRYRTLFHYSKPSASLLANLTSNLTANDIFSSSNYVLIKSYNYLERKKQILQDVFKIGAKENNNILTEKIFTHKASSLQSEVSLNNFSVPSVTKFFKFINQIAKLNLSQIRSHLP